MKDEAPTTELTATLADAYRRFPETMAYLAEQEYGTNQQLAIALKIAIDLADGDPA